MARRGRNWPCHGEAFHNRNSGAQHRLARSPTPSRPGAARIVVELDHLGGRCPGGHSDRAREARGDGRKGLVWLALERSAREARANGPRPARPRDLCPGGRSSASKGGNPQSSASSAPRATARSEHRSRTSSNRYSSLASLFASSRGEGATSFSSSDGICE
ncbi:MAG: hypothetical protein K0Q60_4973 [Microvirga sp.]|nr:hypothetical protein [Microvirga sp.]